MQKLTAQERPWSEREKVSLLAEILKMSPVPSSALLRLAREFDVHPQWEDIPLPEGRSLNSSKLAFDEMHRQAAFYQLHASTSYSHHAPRAQLPPATVPRKRQLPGSDLLTSSFPAIQPKPPGLSSSPYTPVPAESPGSFRPSPGDSAGEPAKKPRGRPSNAQIEREKAAAAAEGREWQPRPPRPPRKKKSKISKDSLSSAEAEASQNPIPQTPDLRMAEAQDEGSSGKKRRRRTQDEATVLRAAPYDPIRQSPLETVSHPGDDLPASGQQPPPSRSLLAEDSNLHPDTTHHSQISHLGEYLSEDACRAANTPTIPNHTTGTASTFPNKKNSQTPHESS